MRAKELLVLLKERGVDCKECRGAEKSFLIQKVRENLHLPVKNKINQENAKGKDESVDDIMAKLKGMPGMENIKVYGRDDIEKMAKQFGNKGDL
ncbi:hypothetical protein GUITHDRAFT_105304 [Guillardia theta CCMP2712]|uniref:Uncharacterized protein n=1 Tax=Guillardia theta (strain CCMP2712) TaxID=905079 RepID=L1JKQ9_GUITC|nr:hypothetical protein GUITHDRAFT_105304 [Guillardia theta CCMP2712]EKX48670.1 hypothetical protein GUITHDRAFT_105304 [Guillardia theta CCMP2712]|eukprot:XP_005835650.1 hypothetical protein GUITHDRAFT_105304 [Guillardia theta CCMP2712]